MTYLDEKILHESIAGNTVYQELISQIKKDADDYFADFKDSPENISRWGHHYFCKEDGGTLIYKKDSPKEHKCSNCGKSWSNDLLNGVWYTMYRNHGVVSAWKAALAYRVSSQERYLNYLLNFVSFYNDNYVQFRLHNKEGLESTSVEDAPWGSSRIMPQALNEAIFIVRLTNALELVKDSLPDGYIQKLEHGMFGEIYRIFLRQIGEINNIPAWLSCGIGVMGLFLGHSEMTEFAFNGEFGINNQLKKGLTADYFWYEGSIHYNHFLLEGVVNLLLFSAIYRKDFPIGKQAVEQMIKAAYSYAFDNHRLPNPNDGWPDLNLKTYSYIYCVAVKVLGEDSECARLTGAILNRSGERKTLPLSRPYFFRNDIALEEFLFAPNLRKRHHHTIRSGSKIFHDSYCAILKNDSVNLFLKYGHNGPNHAHPDKMNIEVLIGNSILSRDLSNAGYGNSLCNEWHRETASHNTVVVNGQSHNGFSGGRCLTEEAHHLRVLAEEVYPGVQYIRDVRIHDFGFSDSFEVKAEDASTVDYIFHVDGHLISSIASIEADLGFNKNGYQHIRDVRRVLCDMPSINMKWEIHEHCIESQIHIDAAELYLIKSPDNPVSNYRPGFILRKRGPSCQFMISWELRRK